MKIFPELNEIDIQLYVEILGNLVEQFTTRFSDFHAIDGEMDLLENLANANIDDAPKEIREELGLLQNDLDLRNSFPVGPLQVEKIEFVQNLDPERFPNLKRRWQVIFPCSYRCETVRIRLFTYETVDKGKSNNIYR